MTAFPEPGSTADVRGLLLDYLDYFRSVIAAKVTGLTPNALYRSQVPSGWTPAGLVTHLAYMERRWLQWGFMGEPHSDPWGDSDGDGWVTPDDDLTTLLGHLEQVGRRTREIVEAHTLTEHATPGGRFVSPAEAPHERGAAGPGELGGAPPWTAPPTRGGRLVSPAGAPQLRWILSPVLEESARHAGHLDITRELVDGVTGESG